VRSPANKPAMARFSIQPAWLMAGYPLAKIRSSTEGAGTTELAGCIEAKRAVVNIGSMRMENTE